MDILTTPVEEPSVWTADGYRRSEDWITTFTDTHLKEIDAALAHLRASGKGPKALTLGKPISLSIRSPMSSGINWRYWNGGVGSFCCAVFLLIATIWKI